MTPIKSSITSSTYYNTSYDEIEQRRTQERSFSIKIKLNQPNIEDAYKKTIKWIKKSYQSKITYSREFDLIQAKYGRHSRTYFDYVEITFKFTQEQNLWVEISLSEKYITDADESDLLNHKYHIEEYLEFMGVDLDNEILKKMYNLEDFISKARGNIIGLIAINIICIVMFFLFYRVYLNYSDIPIFLLSVYVFIINILVELRSKAITMYFINEKRMKNIYN